MLNKLSQGDDLSFSEVDINRVEDELIDSIDSLDIDPEDPIVIEAKYKAEPTEMRITVSEWNAQALSGDEYSNYLVSLPYELGFPTFRVFDCENYEGCLSFSAKEDWPGWSCDGCPNASGIDLDQPPANSLLSFVVINNSSDHLYSKEHWKLIPGYENYIASSFGRIKYLKTNEWVIMKPCRVTKAGQKYRLIKSDEKTVYLLSELILLTFSRINKPKETACHSNNDVNDCRIVNLFWSKPLH